MALRLLRRLEREERERQAEAAAAAAGPVIPCPWCRAELGGRLANRCPDCGLCTCGRCLLSPILAAMNDRAASFADTADKLRELDEYAARKGARS